jgi:tRNA G18 (ribose-2'-O)-methylase SpoU
MTNKRGYFGVGVFHPKHEVNIGTLWRSAYQMGADFVFTIGRRYDVQAADTTKAWRNIPLMHYQGFDDFREHLPFSCRIVAVEMGGKSLSTFTHFERCIYLLGAEDSGLPQDVLNKCHYVVSLDAIRIPSYNVAVAGSIVLYDRMNKRVIEAIT